MFDSVSRSGRRLEIKEKREILFFRPRSRPYESTFYNRQQNNASIMRKLGWKSINSAKTKSRLRPIVCVCALFGNKNETALKKNNER